MKRLNFKVKRTGGITKGGYFMIPILNFGFGSNGFAVIILGLSFTVSYTK